jgi:hypothetical protein
MTGVIICSTCNWRFCNGYDYYHHEAMADYRSSDSRGDYRLLGTLYVGMAVGLATTLTKTATVLLVIVCPVIYSIWWAWWLVPMLNALLYGGLAFGIAMWRNAK